MKPIKIGKMAAFSIVRVDSDDAVTLSISGDAEHRVMICSMASGRVSVGIDKNNFGIGEGGMWKVRGDEVCRIRNAGVEEGVIHVVACA